MISRALTNFIHSLIREQQHITGLTALFVDDLSLEDKKIFMSHIDIFEYEYFINNPTGMTALLDEYKDHMQRLINDEIHDCYVEAMEELGLSRSTNPVNGELLWTKAS